MNDDTLTAILRRIIVEPDCDLHRTVYADRLEELGEPSRARFIRGSIENKGRGFECYSHPQYYDVGFEPWVGGLNMAFNEYERGFVSTWITDAETFLEHADALIWHPDQNRPCPPTAQPVRKVVLTTVLECDCDPVMETDERQRFVLGGMSLYPTKDKWGWGMRPLLEMRWPGGIVFDGPGL